MEKETSNKNGTEALNKALVTSSAAKGMKTELKARMILGLPNDDYKKGFNDAMEWAVRLVDRYEKGEGLFQQ
jgi:hypothetical protein